jgi:hypothetical protein
MTGTPGSGGKGRMEERLTTKALEGIPQGDGNVLHLDFGGGV